MFGWQEMLLVGVIIFILFGASRMGEIGKSLGQGIREFKKAFSDRNDDENEKDKKD
jgi:sec-independent protein translocase protein TatA